MALDDARHPDAERLAEYADGVLEVEARADIERHLADCAECRAIVAETMAFLQANPATSASALSPRVIPFRSRRRVTGVVAGLAAAAALVLAVRVVRPEWANGLFGARGDRPELQELIAALAKEPTRPVEGRLGGGFTYAPPPSPTRGSGRPPFFSSDSKDAIEKTSSQHQSGSDAASRDAFGVASLIAGRLDEAVTALEEAVRLRPASARFHSDLAAAYIERARFGTHPQDLQNALQAAQRAIAQDPTYLEAHFNHALALERLERRDEALREWEAYHRRDPKGPWSAEAVKHAIALMGLPQATPGSIFRSVTQLATQRVPLTLGQQTSILIEAGHESTDFPASYWASLNEDGCSATFVGPKVVLTAGHCVRFEQSPIWLYRGQGIPSLVGRCDRATKFRKDPSGVLDLDDWALCKMDVPAPVAAEVVNIDPAVVPAHTQVIVTGYGCDMTNGKRTIGVSFEIGYMEVADPDFQSTGLISATPINGTTLCEGDSGGGTFAPLAGNRVAVAANSYSDQTTTTMSNLSSAAGANFLYTWSACRAAPICGLDATLDLTECRTLMPPGNTAHLPTTHICPPAWKQP